MTNNSVSGGVAPPETRRFPTALSPHVTDFLKMGACTVGNSEKSAKLSQCYEISSADL